MANEFEVFVQAELPRRPAVITGDPSTETLLVRRSAAPLIYEELDIAEGLVLGKEGGELKGVNVGTTLPVVLADGVTTVQLELGTSGAAAFIIFNEVISPSGAVTVVNLDMTVLRSQNFRVDVNVATGEQETYMVLASLITSGTAVSFVEYAKSGDRIPHTIALDVVAGNLEFSFTNDHVQDINVLVTLV